mgnify:CR=1 FL=1
MLKMLKTRVVNIHYEPCDVYIGRSKDPVKGKWGNPYSHLSGTLAEFKVKTVEEAVEKYKQYIIAQPELMASLHELKGKRLGCFCKLPNQNRICHGDVLVELIESLKNEP